jgi:hypothetical protein
MDGHNSDSMLPKFFGTIKMHFGGGGIKKKESILHFFNKWVTTQKKKSISTKFNFHDETMHIQV